MLKRNPQGCVLHMFGMANDYKSKHAGLATPSVLRTLFQDVDQES